jgi:hypothetical protein
MRLAIGSKVGNVKVKVSSKNGDNELNMGVNWPWALELTRIRIGARLVDTKKLDSKLV